MPAQAVMFGFGVAVTTTAVIFVVVPLARGGTETLRRRAPHLLRLFVIAVVFVSGLSVLRIAAPDLGRAMPLVADLATAVLAGYLLIRAVDARDWGRWRIVLLATIFVLAAATMLVNALISY